MSNVSFPCVKCGTPVQATAYDVSKTCSACGHENNVAAGRERMRKAGGCLKLGLAMGLVVLLGVGGGVFYLAQGEDKGLSDLLEDAGDSAVAAATGITAAPNARYDWYHIHDRPVTVTDATGTRMVGVLRDNHADGYWFGALEVPSMKLLWKAGPYADEDRMKVFASGDKVFVAFAKQVNGQDDPVATEVMALDAATGKGLATFEVSDAIEGMCDATDGLQARQFETGPNSFRTEPIPEDDPEKEPLKGKIRIDSKDKKHLLIDLKTLKQEPYAPPSMGFVDRFNVCRWDSGLEYSSSDYYNVEETQPPSPEGYKISTYCRVGDAHAAVYTKSPGTPIPRVAGFSREKAAVTWEQSLGAAGQELGGTDAVYGHTGYSAHCNSKVFITSYEVRGESEYYYLAAFDLASGKPLWNEKFNGGSMYELAEAAFTEDAYLAISPSCMRSIDPQTGKLLATFGDRCAEDQTE